jgi:tetratricopeptide (TPR) repeat protein
VASVAFSLDGNRIVSGGGDNTIRVWDAANGKKVQTLEGHTEVVTSVAFSSDGKQIVSGSRDRTLKVWNATSGQATITLQGHLEGVTSVAWSRDGSRIASASNDKTIRIWDASRELPKIAKIDPTETDPVKILNEARQFARSGRFDEALQRYLWFHEHAELQPSLHGVRLSFALADWHALGTSYPNAKEALISIRDRDVQGIKNGRFELFKDVARINQYLGDESQTVTLFKLLDEKDREAAKRWYSLVEEELVLQREYGICSRYIPDAIGRFDEIRVRRASNLESDIKFDGGAFRRFVDEKFVEDSRRLIEILIGADRKEDAAKVGERALMVRDDPTIRETIKKALGKHIVTGDGDTGIAIQIGHNAAESDEIRDSWRWSRLQDRGNLLARAGQFQQAAADFDAAIRFHPQEHYLWYQSAGLWLMLGDTEAYRRQCRAMLDRFGKTNDAMLAERTAKACLLIPNSVVDLAPVVRLADQAITGTEEHMYYRYFLFARALAHYRAGEFASAVEKLEKCLVPERPEINRDGAAYLVLAMAHHRIGHAAEAAHAIAKARDIIDVKTWPTINSGNLGDSWHDVLIIHILRREAEALLKETGDKPVK